MSKKNKLNRMNNQVVLDRLYCADELNNLFQVAEYLRDESSTDSLIAVDIQDQDGITIWVHARDMRAAAGRRAKEILAEILE